MSRTFTKLFSSITESTVWCEPDRTRLVWITLMAMADRVGRVWGSIPGIANRARVPVEDARIAMATFLAPDPDSRTSNHEGRRIEVIAGGWRLLNFELYRTMRDEESARESKRKYINARRAKEKSVDPNVEINVYSRTVSNQAEADMLADASHSWENPKTSREAANTGLADANPSKATDAAFEKERDFFEARPSPSKPSALDPDPGGLPTPTDPPGSKARDSALSTPRKKLKISSKPKSEAKGAAVWASYSQAYVERYGVLPVRNTRVNSQLAAFVDRVGMDEAPGIARFYVDSRNAYYVQHGHAVGLLLSDAEKLRTEWVTGRQMMSTQARMIDKTQTNYNAFAPLIAEAREREQKEKEARNA